MVMTQNASADVCNRTSQVRDEIVKILKKSCEKITAEDLKSIQKLDLSMRNIQSIQPQDFAGLDKLENLNLYENRITKIDYLPKSLKVLTLTFNKITKIENLPPSLEELGLADNQISKIENLPESLTHLALSDFGR